MIKRLPADAFRGRGRVRSWSLLASAIAASVILLLSTGLVPAVRVSSAAAGFLLLRRWRCGIVVGLRLVGRQRGGVRCVPGDPHDAFVERSIDEARARAIP